MRAFVGAFAKAVDNLFIFALQMANKHLALLVSFSVESGFNAALLVAAKRYQQAAWTKLRQKNYLTNEYFMLNISSLSTKHQTELKSIGIYQIVGGGLGFVLLGLNGDTVFLSTYIIGALLFSFSIFAGYSCFKLRDNCFTLTFINQVLQTLALIIGNFTFHYIAGAAIGITLDMTDSVKIGFDFNLSTLSSGFYDDSEERYYLGFNLISMYIIYLTEKIKKDIKATT